MRFGRTGKIYTQYPISNLARLRGT